LFTTVGKFKQGCSDLKELKEKLAGFTALASKESLERSLIT
jgi:hypothetical protein